jgi:CubicO group peptidase (beta-lactamase class C family)
LCSRWSPDFAALNPGYRLLQAAVFKSSEIAQYDGPMTHRIRFDRSLPIVVAAVLSCAAPPAKAQPAALNPAMEARIQALIPDLEAYTASAMQAFGVPGLAIGVVAGDRLVYAKGFGVRSKAGRAPVDARTIFQVGSTTKAFLAATIGIMVDRGKLKWDDRVVDLYPEFQLKDPWVTREFRVFDLLAQRSGLPPYANDAPSRRWCPAGRFFRASALSDHVRTRRKETYERRTGRPVPHARI